MSEITQEFNKDGGITNLGDVLGTGAGINTGSESTLTNPPAGENAGFGNTFLTSSSILSTPGLIIK